jgi:hypothetical protein
LKRYNRLVRTVDKKAALYIAHEIIVALDTPIPADSLIIGPDPKLSKSPDDHIIKIKHDLKDHQLKIIASVVEKRSLKIEKLKDIFIIY